MDNEALARTQIYHAMSTYTVGVDNGDVDIILKAFAPDARFDVRGTIHQGHDEIRQFFEWRADEAAQAGSQDLLRHNLTTSYVTFDPDGTATGRTYFFVITNHGPDHSGIYTDRYADVDGTWKLSDRSVTVEWYATGSWFETRRINALGTN